MGAPKLWMKPISYER